MWSRADMSRPPANGRRARRPLVRCTRVAAAASAAARLAVLHAYPRLGEARTGAQSGIGRAPQNTKGHNEQRSRRGAPKQWNAY